MVLQCWRAGLAPVLLDSFLQILGVFICVWGGFDYNFNLSNGCWAI